MPHAGLDLSRRRLDVCVISEPGELVEEFPAPPDADGLRYLVEKVNRHGEPVRAVIESMTGARFVHDTLEQLGWDVRIAAAQKVKGLAPLARKTEMSAAPPIIRRAPFRRPSLAVGRHPQHAPHSTTSTKVRTTNPNLTARRLS
ncbi:MAG: transposase [Solirubrobacteraceae bacterium]